MNLGGFGAMMSNRRDDELEKTKNLMGALVRMKPKPHDEMKVGKRESKNKNNQATKKMKLTAKKKS
jgi:hypothetical protein